MPIEDKVQSLLDVLESDKNYKGAYDYKTLSSDLSDKNKAKELFDVLENDKNYKGSFLNVDELMALKKKEPTTPQGQGILKSGFGESVSGGTKTPEFGTTTITKEQADKAQKELRGKPTKDNPLALTDKELHKSALEGIKGSPAPITDPNKFVDEYFNNLNNPKVKIDAIQDIQTDKNGTTKISKPAIIEQEYKPITPAEFLTEKFNKDYGTNYTPKQISGQEPIPPPKTATEALGDKLIQSSAELVSGALSMPENTAKIVAQLVHSATQAQFTGEGGDIGGIEDQQFDQTSKNINTSISNAFESNPNTQGFVLATKKLDLVSEKYGNEFNKYVSENKNNKSALQGAKNFGLEMAGIVPVFVGFALLPEGVVGEGLSAGIMASQQYNAIKNNPNMSEGQKAANALGIGIINTVGIGYTTKVLQGAFPKLVAKVGLKDAQKIAQENISTAVNASLSKTHPLTNITKGFGNGVGIAGATYLTNVFTDPTKKFDLRELGDDMLHTGFMFMTIHAVGTVAGKAYEKATNVLTKKGKDKVTEIGSKIQTTDADIQKLDDSNPAKQILTDHKENLHLELNDELAKGDEQVDKLTDEDKAKVHELDNKASDLENKIEEIKSVPVDETLSEESKKIIEDKKKADITDLEKEKTVIEKEIDKTINEAKKSMSKEQKDEIETLDMLHKSDWHEGSVNIDPDTPDGAESPLWQVNVSRFNKNVGKNGGMLYNETLSQGGFKTQKEAYDYLREVEGILKIREKIDAKYEAKKNEKIPAEPKAGSVGVVGDVEFTAKGGNKVVDEKGEPLVVYHGTNKEFDKLDADKPQRGLFFTKDKQSAKGYANKKGDGSGMVREAKISLKNPHIIDAKGKSYDEIIVDLDKVDMATGKGVSKKMTTDEIVDALRGKRSEKIVTSLYGTKEKADGIIIKNVKDNFTKQGETTDIYIPFSNEQIAEQSLKETTKAEPIEPQKTDKDYQQAQEINTRISKEHPNASVLIQPKGEDLSLTAIYVGKNNRGKGIGSKVLESVKSEADKVGKKVVLDATNELDKETDIKRLGEFYEKNGFKKVGENKFEYEPKSQVEPITPKEGDIVELQPRVKGGMKPQAVFKDGKWQAKVGKETSEIGKAAQEEAQAAFESSNKPTLEPKTEADVELKDNVFYHGTPTSNAESLISSNNIDLNKFGSEGAKKRAANGLLGKGLYLTNSKEVAKQFGEVLKVTLKKDILNASDFNKTKEKIRDWYVDYINNKRADNKAKPFSKEKANEYFDSFDNQYDEEYVQALNDYAKENGYGGVKHNDDITVIWDNSIIDKIEKDLPTEQSLKETPKAVSGGKGENAPENLKKLAEDNNLPSFRNVVNLVNKYVREVNLEEGKTITDTEVKQALKNKEEGVTREGWVSKIEKTEPKEVIKEPTEKVFTEIKKAELSEAAKKLEGVDFPKTKGWGESVKNGLELLAKESKDGEHIYDTANNKIEKLANSPELEKHNPNDEEIAQYAYHRTVTRQRMADLSERLSSKDETEVISAMADMAVLENNLNNVDKVLQQTAKTAGRSFNIRQIVGSIDAQNEFQVQKNLLVAKQGGKELSPKQEKEVDALVKRKTENDKAILQAEKKKNDAEFDRRVKDEVLRQLKQKGGAATKIRYEVSAKRVANSIRKLKMPKGTHVRFDLGSWDLAVEGVARLVEKGIKIANAIKILIDEGTISFSSKKDHIDFQNHLENYNKNEILQDIEDLAKKEDAKNLTLSAVGQDKIIALVNDAISKGVRGEEVLNNIYEDLKGIFPDITKEQVRDAYLKEGEYKLEDEATIRNEVTDAKSELKVITKLQKDLENLKEFGEVIKDSKNKDSRPVGKHEAKLKAEKEAVIKEISDEKKLQDETKRAVEKAQEIRDNEDKKAAEKAKLAGETANAKALFNEIKQRREAVIKEKAAEQSKLEKHREKIADLIGKLRDIENKGELWGKSKNKSPEKIDAETQELKDKIDAAINKKGIKIERGNKDDVALKNKVAESHNSSIDGLIKNIESKISGADVGDKIILESAKGKLEKAKVDINSAQDINQKIDNSMDNIYKVDLYLHENKIDMSDDILEANRKTRDGIKSSDMEVELNVYKRNLENKIKQNQRKIDRQEFTDKKTSPTILPDSETIRLEIKDRDIKNRLYKLAEQARRDNMTGFGKVLDVIQNIYIAGLIGHFSTLKVVAASAIIKPLFLTATKATAGQVSSFLFRKGLSKAATGETGFSMRVEAHRYKAQYGAKTEKQYADLVNKSREALHRADAKMIDVNNELKDIEENYGKDSKEYEDFVKNDLAKAEGKQKGAILDHLSNSLYNWIGANAWADAANNFIYSVSRLDELMGHGGKESFKDLSKNEKFKSIISVMGNLHGSLKTLSARSEFAATFVTRLENKLRNGEDIRSASEILKIVNESYLNFERGKYSQDNFIYSKYKGVMKSLSIIDKNKPQWDNYSKLAASGAKIKYPVVKIGLNVVHDAIMEYTFGLPIAMARHGYETGKAVKGVLSESEVKTWSELKDRVNKKMSELPPEKANAIMRAYAKGGFSALAIALAYTGVIAFSGFKDDKDKKHKKGKISIMGIELTKDQTKIAMHTAPIMPALLLNNYLTVRKEELGKGSSEVEANWESLKSDLEFIIEEVPFFKKNFSSKNVPIVGSLPLLENFSDASAWWDVDEEGEVVERDKTQIKNAILVGSGLGVFAQKAADVKAEKAQTTHEKQLHKNQEEKDIKTKENFDFKLGKIDKMIKRNVNEKFYDPEYGKVYYGESLVKHKAELIKNEDERLAKAKESRENAKENILSLNLTKEELGLKDRFSKIKNATDIIKDKAKEMVGNNESLALQLYNDWYGKEIISSNEYDKLVDVQGNLIK